MAKQDFLSPVGRLVMGSLYKPSTKDADGNPLVFKTGANAGQARTNFFLALAVPKGTETHWNQTEWGAKIWNAGAAAFPQAHKSPAFAWKVADGNDSTPNTRGKSNSNTEGFPGNWILRFSSSFAPRVYRMENGAYVQVTDPDYIKPGYYVQISGTVDGNNSQQKPGVYLNQDMVAFIGYGQEIHFGRDANAVGFGGALPAGASATPLASGVPLPSSAPVTQPSPSTAFVPPPPPPSAAKGMTDKAKGASYEAFKAGGWSDEALVAQGFMVA